MDKIGSGNWFWSFPSKEAGALRAKVKALTDRKAALEKEVATLTEREAELLRDRPQTEARTKKLAEFEALKAKKAELLAVIKDAAANDPEEARKLQKACAEAKAAADRWTDNIWSAQDWIRKTYGASKQDAAKQVGVSEEFDYAVYKPKTGGK